MYRHALGHFKLSKLLTESKAKRRKSLYSISFENSLVVKSPFVGKDVAPFLCSKYYLEEYGKGCVGFREHSCLNENSF